MAERAWEVNCGVEEWVKRNTLRCYGHVRRMMEARMAKRVWQSSVPVVDFRGRGRSPRSWGGRVKQYVRE